MAKKKNINVDDLLSQGLEIIAQEIAKVKKIQKDSPTEILDSKTAATLTDYIKTLLSTKREGRMAAVEADLEKMDDDSFKALTKAALDYAQKENK